MPSSTTDAQTKGGAVQRSEPLQTLKSSSIAVNVKAVKITNHLLEEQPPRLRKHVNADTVWSFHMAPQFSYDLLAHSSQSRREHATIEITAVKMDLGLDISYYMPRASGDALKKHEEGHAQICRQRYAQAEGIAKSCARKVLGRSYSGEGDDLNSACVAAASLAAQDLVRAYDNQTNVYVTRVSKLYDTLERKDPNQKISTAVERAEQLTPADR